MRQHQQGVVGKSGRPAWLEGAHREARGFLPRVGGHKLRDIMTREETGAKNAIKAVVAEGRLDIPVPAELKGTVRNIFVKMNVAVELQSEMVTNVALRSRVLVLVFKNTQGGIKGVPSVGSNKYRKDGHTHVTITSVPKTARERQILEAMDRDRYDESGFCITFYKPAGGHRHEGDKGGEEVQRFQDELTVLQWLYENDLTALYTVKYLVSWGYLPKTDEIREEENAATAAIQMMFGRSGQYHAESAYHSHRLFCRFADLHQPNVESDAEMHEKAAASLAETVIGKMKVQRVESGTSEHRIFYYSDAQGIAYAIHNTADGQYVVKIDVKARTCEVGLTKTDIDGLTLMENYDSFLTSQGFRQVDSHEFASRTSGVGLATRALSATA